MGFFKGITGFGLGAAAGWIFVKAAMPSVCMPGLASFLGCLEPFSSLNTAIILAFAVAGAIILGR
ncbi:hypothetical protein HY991_03565 [Candidatus Micrarchaeota archaeon]|nr:hypothetical protein [Candidatus Micrarchaeota archaeon]